MATGSEVGRDKQNFIQDVFISSAIRDSITTRGGRRVYVAQVSPEQRWKLRSVIQKALIRITEQYFRPVAEEGHIQNIRELMTEVSQVCQPFLNEGYINFGISQKVLNSYLKYLWCNSQIPLPPHCPFDAIIIRKLALPNGCCSQWTKGDENAYRVWIVAAKSAAGTEPLSKWELLQWS